MFDIFQYSFIIRGIEAGIVVGIIAPLIGTFLVLRRYSLIADTLSHVALAGIAVGFITGIHPIIAATATSVAASVFIERLRTTKRVYGESALSLFLSGSLAIAVILLSIGNGLSGTLFSYLFGSITTVTSSDLWVISILGIIVILTVIAFYKELFYITFDEETAAVNGLPTRLLNTIFIILSAVTITISIPIVGILLISALMVIPVVTALQLRKSFRTTIILAECFSLSAVCIGIISSFYLDIPSGGAIVVVALLQFLLTLVIQ